MRALTAVVWVRRMFFWASSIFQSYLYLKDSRTLENVVMSFVESWWMLFVMWARDYVSPLWTKASLWVDLLHSLQVVLREIMGECRVWKMMFRINDIKKWLGYNSVWRDSERAKCTTHTRQEEGVVLVSGRVLLGLEQGVEVPERALYEVVGRHLCEATESRGFICICF